MTQGISSNQKSISIIRRSFCSEKSLTATLTTVIFASIVTFVIFWCTDVLQSSIISRIVISNNTPMFEWWTKPPVRAVYKIRIFNYTNVEDFERGKAKKLKVAETGPYIYRETLTRLHQTFHPNGTISFKEKRRFQWEGGSPDDEIVTVPSVPLISAMALARDSPYIVRIALTFLTAFGPKPSGPFINVSAGEFLWGYDDNLFDVAKSLMKFQKNIPFEKFGILAYKNGISQQSMTMHTGQDDYQKLGLLEKVGGKNNRGIWHDKECDRVHGTEGFMFPPGMYARPNAALDVYAVDMCRSLKLVREGSGESFGIPTLKFTPSPDIFTSTPTKNTCFCSKISDKEVTKTTCPPSGVFNGSACSFGLPIITSFPHFYAGDSILRENIDGLNPQKELHQSSVEIHPRVGILIGGASKIQINVEARRAASVPFLGKIKDGQILPLIWIEVTVDKMPETMLTLFWHAYFTIGYIETLLKWSSIVGIFLPTLILLSMLQQNRKNHHMAFKTNIRGQNKLLEENAKKTQDGHTIV